MIYIRILYTFEWRSYTKIVRIIYYAFKNSDVILKSKYLTNLITT